MAAAAEPRAPGPIRRISAALFRRPGLKLALTLGTPVLWMLVVYLGALGFLFVAAFWHLDTFSGLVVKEYGLSNFQRLWDVQVYRTITVRTLGIAAAVTIADVALALPLAYYLARVISPRFRSALLIAIVMPLWVSYLVRVFAWKLILTPNGFLNWLVELTGIGSLQLGNSNWALFIVFTYLWLPFMVLPIFTALERIPESYLEASSDLGGREWVTFARVVWPLAFPGIVAGSIFTFSLTLGDYIAPSLVANTKFIGNVIYDSVGVANDLPLGAAFAVVPVVIMGVYLLVAKRLGAFEAL
ncbi:MAG: ABC transporter permease [Actinobacteria bacterium]|nr:ABC transporter permease [Actinomycetota bacterium]